MKPYNFDQSPKARLAYYKASEEQIRKNYPEAHPNYIATHSWRNKSARYPKPAFLKKGNITRSEDGKKIYFDNLKEWTFGDYQDAHDIGDLRHTGWYADNFQGDIIRGAVVSFRNPHKFNDDYENDSYYYVDEFKSHIFYYPATYSTDWDGVTVYLDEYTDIRDCARRADQLAEREAEESREYDAKYQAEQQIEDLKTEIKESRRAILELCQEIKQAKREFTPAICSALTGTIKEHLRDRKKAFRRIAKLQDNYWLAVE